MPRPLCRPYKGVWTRAFDPHQPQPPPLPPQNPSPSGAAARARGRRRATISSLPVANRDAPELRLGTVRSSRVRKSKDLKTQLSSSNTLKKNKITVRSF
ncbi:hypothetical protein C2845_PM17G06200 [Panicum miliaceum]|uniref:Uncharacterized protein n=1 Tax=Panicum miliaceum TaxID=4540 RepID=A0A3L6Q128_PANMI|nr:hypothetical protein C2845_PM17G06200 [Panicum miliaceum]